MRPHVLAVPLALAVPDVGVAQSGWIQRQPANAPSARGWHQLAHDLTRGVTVLFGGIGSTTVGDTWEWNGTDWSPRTTTNTPLPRWGHAMAFDVGTSRVILFGGNAFADTWSYNGSDWTQLQPRNSPPGRRMAAMAWLSGRSSLILFGGALSSSGRLADTWEWRTGNWTQLSPPNAPPPREAHGMAGDWARNRVLLFGGWTTTPESDSWAFDGIDWRLVTSPSAAPPGAGNTALAFDLGTATAVQFGGFQRNPNQFSDRAWLHDGQQWIEDTRLPGPAGRRSFSLAYDPARSMILMFGGNAGGYFADTWEFRLGRPAGWLPLGNGCAGSSGTPTLQTASAGRPVTGGSWTLELTGAAGSLAAFAHGLSTTNWNGNALPLDLVTFGMPGCRLLVAPDVTAFATVTAGIAVQTLQVPASPPLLGVRFASQGFVLAPGSNPLGVASSNAGIATIGEY